MVDLKGSMRQAGTRVISTLRQLHPKSVEFVKQSRENKEKLAAETMKRRYFNKRRHDTYLRK